MPTELPPRRITIKDSPIGQLGLIVIVSAILLDIFDLWGRFFGPELLSQTACSLLPFTKAIWPITYNQTISSAYSLCSRGLISEPAISIIILMLKLSIAVTAIIPMWVLTVFTGVEFRIAKGRLFAKFDKPNGLREQTQLISAAMIIIGVLCWAMFRLILSGEATTWLTSVQKPMEDIITAFTYLFSLMVTWFPVIVTQYCWKGGNVG